MPGRRACAGVLVGLDGCEVRLSSQVKSSLYINNRQPYGSLSNVLRRPAVVELDLRLGCVREGVPNAMA